MFRLTADPIDCAAMQSICGDPRAGAQAMFTGMVRNHHEGREVVMLEYEAYEPLARREGERVCAEAAALPDVLRVECVHRTGTLRVGEVATCVVVLAAHRAAAFDACRYVIDEMKKRVPIWKKEYYRDGGSRWVECPEGRAH